MAGAVIVLVLIALLWHSRVLFFVSFNPFAGQAEIRYEERMVSASKEDSVRLCTLLYGKGLHYDNSSCGFRAEVSISFGSDRFLPACDGDGIVENNGKYLTLSVTETRELHDILENMRFIFRAYKY